MFTTDDTICAIASPSGSGLRGIVRMSGPETSRIVGLLAPSYELPHETRRFAAQIECGDPLGLIDASILFWPGQQSYTGMPSAEIHTIGCQPILEAIVEKMLELGGRLAQPGEFTMRAFLAGRIDLTEAEAVLGVIDAEDDRTLNAALRQLSGGLSEPLAQLRNQLIELLANLEAGLDFVEEDIEFISREQLLGGLHQIIEQVSDIRSQMQFREGNRTRPRVVLRGLPNAGKSSLMNALVESSIAIVSPEEGTTRDWIEAIITIGGLELSLIDTAGTGRDQEQVDIASQKLGESAQQDADLVLWCIDLSAGLTEHALAQLPASYDENAGILVGTKIDCCDRKIDVSSNDWILTSSTRGDGIDRLRGQLVARLVQGTGETVSVASTALRCMETLNEAIEALGRAIEIVHGGLGDELIASELRLALDAIGRVTGVVYTDDILDLVFGRFCIGK